MEHIRIALLTPTLHLGDPLFTKKEHLSLKKMAIDDGAKLLIYPLNSLLGSIDSLLLQGDLKAAKEEALKEIVDGDVYSLIAEEYKDSIEVILYKNGVPLTKNRAKKIGAHEGIVSLDFSPEGELTMPYRFKGKVQDQHSFLCIHFVGSSTYVAQEEMIKRAHGNKDYCLLFSSRGESTTDGVSLGISFAHIKGNDYRATKGLCLFNYPLGKKRYFYEKPRNSHVIYPNFAFDEEIPMLPFIAHQGDYEHVHLEDVKEAIAIQTNALIARMERIHIKKAVLGLSGGLDSSLALIVTYEAFKKMNWDLSDLSVYTLPAFGTSERTKENVSLLVNALGVSLKEISLKDTLLSHFHDIEHNLNDFDTCYENAQARERTQVLMDIANEKNAIMVGTGDMSELALGWTTFNGDHMSMYAVNGGVPKTLVRYLSIGYGKLHPEVGKAIDAILHTPVSPELLPLNEKGEIEQKTEENLGPYEVHDFYLYGFLEGATLKTIYQKACHTFSSLYSKEELKKWLKIFVSRFLTQSFKRNCMPDGPQVTIYSLSVRSPGYHFPSDISPQYLLSLVDEL